MPHPDTPDTPDDADAAFTADDTDTARRLIAEYRALPADSDRKRAIIAELDADVTAQPFLVSVVADAGEYDLARVECATLLRLWPPADPGLAHRAGRALLAALNDPEEDLVRQYAVLALGPYASDPAVTEALTAAARADEDPLVQVGARSVLEAVGKT